MVASNLRPFVSRWAIAKRTWQRGAGAEAGAGAGARSSPPAGLLRELGRLSALHMRRAARCSYSALGQDSTESLVMPKSHSAHAMERPAEPGPREADEAERRRADISREPISVPDFADMVLPTPVLSPAEAAKLVYLDSDEEEEMRRELGGEAIPLRRLGAALPEPAARARARAREDDSELSTSDYASAERVNRLSGASLGFCNPHYLGPDVRALGAALTPDSGVGEEPARRAGGAPGPAPAPALLLVGGREPPHVARLQSPISLWTFRLS